MALETSPYTKLEHIQMETGWGHRTRTYASRNHGRQCNSITEPESQNTVYGTRAPRMEPRWALEHLIAGTARPSNRSRGRYSIGAIRCRVHTNHNGLQ